MTKLILSTIILAASLQANASQFFSAHFCQPYTNGGVPAVQFYYQNQGSILLAADTTLVCPISGENLNGSVDVKLYYSTAGVATPSPVSCRVAKISSTNDTRFGALKVGLANQNSAQLSLLSDNGPINTIGANVECLMKKGTKILGYKVN